MANAKKAVEDLKQKQQQTEQRRSQFNGQSQTNEQQQTTNRASQAGSNAASNATEKIVEDVSDKLATDIADRIAFLSLQKAFDKLSKGEFSDKVNNYIGSLSVGLDSKIEQNRLAIDQEIDPKYLLLSSSDLNDTQNNYQSDLQNNSYHQTTTQTITVKAEIGEWGEEVMEMESTETQPLEK